MFSFHKHRLDFKHLKHLQRDARSWIVKQVHSKYAVWVLAIISFAESSFFPIPPDILLSPLVIINKKRWAYYATVATVASALGGLAGYFIGAGLFDVFGAKIIDAFHLQDEMIKVAALLDRGSSLAIFVSAFTFIPYKVFTISAGIFKINIAGFIIASVVGRGLRFFLEAFLMKLYGKRIAKAIIKYLNIFTIVLLVGFGVFVYFLLR